MTSNFSLLRLQIKTLDVTYEAELETVGEAEGGRGVYTYLILIDVWEKPTPYCKQESAIKTKTKQSL